MIYYTQKIFAPIVVLVGIVFFPLFVLLSLCLFVGFSVPLLVVTCMITAFFVFVLILFGRISKSNRYYLKLTTYEMEIRYPNVNSGTHQLNISYEDVKRIEYYKITSLISWAQLFTYVLPKSVYLTYEKEGKEFTELVGYLNKQDVVDIAITKNILLIEH